MANRVTSSDVKQIMDNCSVSDEIVETLITSVNALLSKVFESDTSMNEVILTEIERQLSAHFVASGIQRSTVREKVGDAEVIYTGKWEEGLKSTPYGQNALSLDFTGKLARLGKRNVRIFAIPSFED